MSNKKNNLISPQAVKVPTVWETIDMWKKNHNPFRIACGWFLANSCFLCFGLL